ncbi:sensor domain-containing diguanylate cyclase [Pseudidiomarina sp. GXY010]|uniref:diguanylate cyclase n=1 Tax=Pseudidiomarina fusca TaxID=2965078 RepID=A0ABU3KW93_9GAMM|nr:sensor domain-containing diguanylate cyclase [Pseudidiomarina sp. GXY010]MDT7525634.1 sensor domain-containing diguanylate cyclase [Pseudidiomarina sp. GXY010]
MTSTVSDFFNPQQVPVGLLAINAERQIVDINQPLLELLAYQVNELMGQSIDKLFSGAGKLFFLTHVFPLMQHQGTVEEMYLRLKDKQNNELPVLVNAVKLPAANNGFVMVLLPIHRRFIFEDQLVAAKKEAERALREKQLVVAELERARVELEHKHQQLTELNKQLERLATTDSLTQLANRRTFEQQLELELEKVKRGYASAALLVMDIDHFKSINDNFGHAEGDVVLRRMGQVLAEQTRAIDTVARIGGEEFALIVSGASLAEAEQAAQRIRELVEQTGWAHGQVTMSIGVTSMLVEDDLVAVLQRADRALYEAKHKGRNRVEVSAEN